MDLDAGIFAKDQNYKLYIQWFETLSTGLSRFIFFFISVLTVHQDYFTHFEPSQS